MDSPGVFVYGQLPHSEVAKHYQTAHVSVMLTDPHLFETFGKATEEAIACGSEVLVSESGALPERVRLSGVGVIINTLGPNTVADALSKIISSPPVTYEYVSPFTWTMSAIELVTTHYICMREKYSANPENLSDQCFSEIFS